MFSRRYTIAIGDSRSGVERRAIVSLRPVLVTVGAVVTLPVLIGLGAAWKAKSDVQGVFASHRALEIENANYRAATEALAGQIEALQTTIADLGAQSALDSNLTRAMEKLPALVKARAMGGNTGGSALTTNTSEPGYARTLSALTSPDDTFGLLRSLLEGLESRLYVVRSVVERRKELAAATPSIWPAHGWLSSSMGQRTDPVTGAPEFHAGLDIVGDKGQPVYATAAGTVTYSEYQGSYGNLVVVDHGFGLETRYGHLSAFGVKKGDRVQRGDIIGRVGATGRATGNHLHYEVLANGNLLNPLRLLTQKARDQ
jgi:murein DD-endopeptidase MepM/ murein hydrolase activator NlpD